MLKLSQKELEIINTSSFSPMMEKVVTGVKKPSILDLTEKELEIINTPSFGQINQKVEIIEEVQERVSNTTETTIEPEVIVPLANVIKSNWQVIAEALKANDGLAEINSKLTRVTILGCIGDDVVILPTKTIKAKDKFMWKAELKALKLDGNIVLESDKVLGKLDVVTTSPDVEEMVSVYNTTVDVDNQIVGFIQI